MDLPWLSSDPRLEGQLGPQPTGLLFIYALGSYRGAQQRMS